MWEIRGDFERDGETKGEERLGRRREAKQAERSSIQGSFPPLRTWYDEEYAVGLVFGFGREERMSF